MHEDQAAILARRRRLIALSLLGLTGPACVSTAPPIPAAGVPEQPTEPVYQSDAPERGSCRIARPCLSINKARREELEELEKARREELLELERQAFESFGEVEDSVEADPEPEPEP